MPEIKHTFQLGKMNKDLDERLVPNGEFRDAQNIQVRTSDTNDIGTVQNIMGTAKVGSSYYAGNDSWMDETPPIVVASVADEKNDKAYFFFASPPVSNFIDTSMNVVNEPITSERVFIDSIIEQDVSGQTSPVAVDRHTVINLFSEVLPETLYDPANFIEPWTSFQVDDASKYRVDMTIKALAPNPNDNNQLVDLFVQYVTQGGTITSSQNGNGAKIKAIDLTTNTITLYEEQTTDLSGVQYFVFEAQPVLNFQGNQITGINVVDDLLFWTDNLSEPKKVNISRCKEGSVDYETHTQLFVKHATLSVPGSETYVSVDTVNPGLESHPVNTDLLEEHLTVLRQAPRTAPNIEMRKTLRSLNVSVELQYQFADDDGDIIAEEGDELVISVDDSTFNNTDWRNGDVLSIVRVENPDDGGLQVTFVNYVEYDDATQSWLASLEPTQNIQVVVESIVAPIPALQTTWRISLKQKKPLFELKLPRFGYRYKYEDGEYSAFSPWSELAFLPGEFDLVIKKAHNLGMVNTIRELIVKDFIPHDRPLDVTAIDLLYKESSKPNVYVVKTIARTKDDDWEVNTSSVLNPDEIKEGRVNITSEMIHKVLPSTQTLRAWDNVPRYALAQEITGNRLVYGNYTQGYPFNTPVNLTTSIQSDTTASLTTPKKSIKSIRDYKWGMVFGDRYGRETPVVETGYTAANSQEYESMSGDITVTKDKAHLRNYFTLQQGWDSLTSPNGEPPSWADYVKYYVKETSNEYYNMVMDRWYWADEEKDNVWVSFNSADRNKVDEESYLILKNQHGNHNPVSDKARFKIIAIENDAPDFIKTVRRNIGEVEIYPAICNKHETFASDGGAVLTQTAWSLGSTPTGDLTTSPSQVPPQTLTDQPPEGLMTQTTIQIYMRGWNETISGWSMTSSNPPTFEVLDFSNSLFGRRIDGNIKLRIKGDNGVNQLYTEYRSLYHYRFIDPPENPPQFLANTATNSTTATDLGINGPFQQKIELNWDSVWGEEAYMHQRFTDNGYGTANLRMFLEFVEDDIDHRPQFDGKFFVKLERNYELEVNVLYAEGSGGVFFNAGRFTYLNIENSLTGDCNSNVYTRDYWVDASYLNFAVSGNAATNVLGGCFIDQISPFYARFPNTPVNDPDFTLGTTQSFTYGFNELTWEGGFQAGTLTNGDMGRMYISRTNLQYVSGEVDTNNDGVPDIGGSPGFYDDGQFGNLVETQAQELMNELSEVGTIFRFASDIQTTFVVVNTEFGVGPPPSTTSLPRNYGGVVPAGDSPNALETVQNIDPNVFGTADCEPCGPDAGSGNGPCQRYMLRVDFRRLNPDTGQANMGLGLDMQNTNPFFNMNPNGTLYGDDFQPRIYILKPDDKFGSAGIRMELGGCWETEPKDNADLDIYYEASNAIPMKLTPYNSFDFAPLNSKVTIRRWVTQTNDDGTSTNTLSDITLYDNFSNHKVSNIEFTNDSSLIYVTSENAFGVESAHIHDIAVGDIMVFTHSDGTETMSEVVGDYIPVETPVTGSTPFIPATTVYRELCMTGNTSTNLYINNAEDLEVGMQIYSTDTEIQQINNTNSSNNSSIIPDGYIITSINPDDTFYNDVFASADSPGVNITIGTESNANIAPFTTWDLTPITQWATDSGFGTDPTYPYNIPVRISNTAGYYEIDTDVWKYKIKLAWFNCYSFGNGVESDRIRDDFNAPQLDNGVRASTTFSGYGEEKKSSGMIYSGLYNSISEVNDLNEFNMGEKIQKDLNPAYGSIQALKTRDTDIVVFAEDKILKVLANKDAVYNADGNPQLTATNRVLGTAVPFGGDYGISKNPESIAVDQFRMYFTDKQRGAVLRLSRDGITPISQVGMKSWFRENLRKCNNILGTFDAVNGEYNITLNYNVDQSPIVAEVSDTIGANIDNWIYDAKTVSFNEGAKGWVSFKSFIPQGGVSVSGKYITARDSNIWEHYRKLDVDGITPISFSNFYGTQYESRFSVVFNDIPSMVKNFNTINYEGSQSYVQSNTQDKEYYNLQSKEGWYVNSFVTDLQSGHVPEFIEKEGKWFNRIHGETTTLSNIDSSEFTVQGIGVPAVISGDYTEASFILTVQNNEDENSNATVSETNSSSSTIEG